MHFHDILAAIETHPVVGIEGPFGCTIRKTWRHEKLEALLPQLSGRNATFRPQRDDAATANMQGDAVKWDIGHMQEITVSTHRFARFKVVKDVVREVQTNVCRVLFCDWRDE